MIEVTHISETLRPQLRRLLVRVETRIVAGTASDDDLAGAAHLRHALGLGARDTADDETAAAVPLGA